MANKVGRPLKYETKEKLQKAIDKYFAKCDARTKTIISKIGREEIEDPEPYTMSGLALTIGLSRTGLLDYTNHKDQEFLNTIKNARDKVHADVERRLMEGAGAGAIFNLKNNFGWVDKTEVENTNLNQDLTIKLPDED